MGLESASSMKVRGGEAVSVFCVSQRVHFDPRTSFMIAAFVTQSTDGTKAL
jgi:hypothetical protein